MTEGIIMIDYSKPKKIDYSKPAPAKPRMITLQRGESVTLTATGWVKN